MNIIDVKNTTQWGRRAPVIGIDLGTTNASAAVYLKDGNMIKPDGNVKIIAIEDNQDDQEKGTTANCVAFTETETLRGSPAKSRVFLNPENSIFEMKRMIGRKFDDPKIQQDMENWPFKVVNVDGVLKIHAEALGETKTFVPEEIIAIFLDKIKRGWCSFFDGNLDEVGVVIAVPACFNDSQRQATMNAAQIAGLRATLINEPTAAALAYGFEENLRGDKNVLIFDLGGGSLDASVINIKDGLRIEVKSTAGDSDLGGVDFDNLLVAHFIKEFKKKHRRDLQTCPKALQRLRYNCEYAKRRLSSYFEVGICIENLFEGKNFESELTRAQFEDMCTDLFRSTLRPVERALSDAEMAKGSIDEVVLIGGSTRIPKIKELLKDFFDGKEPLSISLDGAVAYGAAVYAAREYEVADEKVSSVNVVDITPVSLGIETIGGVMTPIFKRNSQIPCYMTNAFITAVDNQSSIDVNVYEGEQAMAKDNRWVGRFTIQNIPPAPKEVPQIEVKTRLSASGFEVLEIVQPSLVTYLGLPDDEVIRMSDELLRLQEDEKIRRERNKARRDFEEYLFFRKEQLESSSTDSLPNKEFWMRFCDTQLEWMMTHPMEDPRDIEQKHIDVHFEMIGYHDE